MNFQSLSFLLFLILAVPLVLAVGRKNRAAARWLLLLGCGVFYLAALDRQALSGFLVLLGGVIVTYGAVTVRTTGRAPYLLAACWHIGVLLWFKCAGFFDPTLYHGWMPLGLSTKKPLRACRSSAAR